MPKSSRSDSTASSPRFRTWGSVLLIALLLALGGCGEGSGGASATTGSVAVVVTDAPTDEFVQVWVTVVQIDLLGDGETSSQRIFDGERTFDLLALESVSEPFAIAEDVPVGQYSKIRLELSEIELVRMDGSGGLESVFPSLPGGNRIDLNPRGGFEVRPGELLAVRLDLDARRSIQIVGSGNGAYHFRSQVFVDILNAGLPGRLIFVEGTLREIDRSARPNLLELCEVDFAYRSSSEDAEVGCIRVFADGETGVFDASGEAVDLDAVEIDDRLGIFGRFEIAEEDGDERFALDAEVIEIGGSAGFLALKGQVVEGYDALSRSFVIELDPGQGFVDPTRLEVLVVDSTGLFSRDGDEIEASDFEVDDLVEVDGVLDTNSGDPDVLRAAIAFDLGMPESL